MTTFAWDNGKIKLQKQGVWLKPILEKSAYLLETSIDNIYLLTNHCRASNYIAWENGGDTFIKSIGLEDGVPALIDSSSKSTPYSRSDSLTLYAIRNDNSLKYVIVYLLKKDSNEYGNILLACRKGELFRIIRQSLRSYKSSIKPFKPVMQEEVIDDIVNNTIGFIKNRRKIEKYGAKLKRGILIDGPPGNGKTLVCKYIRELCVANSISWDAMTTTDIEKAIHENSLQALFSANKVTFFDDIDISYLNRMSGNGKAACAILSAMDGIHDNLTSVVRIFTTNECIRDLDPAFTRPGRIDKKYTFNKPTEELRARLISGWNDGVKSLIDCDYLIRETEGMSFAEIEEVKSNIVCNYIANKDVNIDNILSSLKNSDHIIGRKKEIGFVK